MADVIHLCASQVDKRATASVVVNLAALTDNLNLVRAARPGSRVMAVIKADAYGHGLIPAANALTGADGLAVARFDEALALRAAGVRNRLLLLATCLNTEAVDACASLNIDITIHDRASLEAACAASKLPAVWLKLDTGMHRAGFCESDFIAADALLRNRVPRPELIHMTHFSAADGLESDVFDRQLETFLSVQRLCGDAPASLANSAALQRSHAACRDWIRPGILLYGGCAYAGQPLAVRPAMRFLGKVTAIRELEAGERIGYHGRWTATHRSRVATIGVGYGDGYPRNARDGTPIHTDVGPARLAGRVSMDMLTADISDCSKMTVGDEVELWGPHLPASAVAAYAETIDYDLLAGLTARPQRRYVE